MANAASTAAGTAAPRPTLHKVTPKRDRAASYAFLMPTVLLILGLSVFPLLFSFALVFLSWDLSRLEGGIRFAGLQNFVTLFNDTRFWNTARVTVIFVLASVTLQYFLGLALALLLNQDIKGRRFFRVAFLIPMMLTPAAVGYVGRMLFNESQGPINDLLQRVGLPNIPWLSNPTMALPSLILLDTWEWVPFMIIVLLAGLQALPPEVFESARVDGAGEWYIFRHITFPMLAPVSITVIVIRALEAFKLFDIVMVMTGGGPGTATETVTMYAYTVGMKNGNLGYASALAYSLLVMVIIFTTLFINTTRRAAQAED
ncbi:MAG: sugar ABC transporter permease [Anaerolineae bacterium]|nr:sugar ABC transporter permease [Anaerolineae bacterium]